MQVSHNGIMPAIGAAFYRRWRGLKCLTSLWKSKKISIAFLKFNDRAIQNGIIIVSCHVSSDTIGRKKAVKRAPSWLDLSGHVSVPGRLDCAVQRHSRWSYVRSAFGFSCIAVAVDWKVVIRLHRLRSWSLGWSCTQCHPRICAGSGSIAITKALTCRGTLRTPLVHCHDCRKKDKASGN